MTRREVMAALVAGGTALLAGCGSLSPAARYRFRMTVEVDTPQGLRTGSSVMQVSSSKTPGPLIGEEHPLTTGLVGEAVAVDVQPEQTLFALIGNLPNGGGLEGEVTKLFEPNTIGPDAFVESVGRLGRPSQVGRTAVLPREHYPTFVRFRDLADPKSVEAADPGNLAASFGPGVTLRRITVTITDDDVTTGIETRLGWLSKQRGSLINAVASDPKPLRELSNITEGDFSKGLMK